MCEDMCWSWRYQTLGPFLFFLVHQTIAFGHLSSWITQPGPLGPLRRRKRLNVVAILLNASIPSIAFAMSGWVCLASSFGNEPSIVKDISIDICWYINWYIWIYISMEIYIYIHLFSWFWYILCNSIIWAVFTYGWLVVWNMAFIFHILWIIIPSD
jgi:hypothetical protein